MWIQSLCISWWEFFLPYPNSSFSPGWSVLALGHHRPWLTSFQGVASKLCSLQLRQTFMLPRGGASVITGWL